MEDIIQGLKNLKNGDWTWEPFLEYLDGQTAGNEIFMCASGGHAWLVARLGDYFKVPKKYIYGDGWKEDKDNGEKSWYNELCSPGWYRIHASGPGPESVLFKSYTLAKLKAKLNPKPDEMNKLDQYFIDNLNNQVDLEGRDKDVKEFKY